MNTEHFVDIKAYLSRLRKWEFVIVDDTEYVLSFYLNNKYARKWFYLTYADFDHELESCTIPRPHYHYYYCQFSQENVGRLGAFVTLYDTKWLCDEDDVIHWIKNRQRVG